VKEGGCEERAGERDASSCRASVMTVGSRLG
jgi:hypothetical protein